MPRFGSPAYFKRFAPKPGETLPDFTPDSRESHNFTGYLPEQRYVRVRPEGLKSYSRNEWQTVKPRKPVRPDTRPPMDKVDDHAFRHYSDRHQDKNARIAVESDDHKTMHELRSEWRQVDQDRDQRIREMFQRGKDRMTDK